MGIYSSDIVYYGRLLKKSSYEKLIEAFPEVLQNRFLHIYSNDLAILAVPKSFNNKKILEYKNLLSTQTNPTNLTNCMNDSISAWSVCENSTCENSTCENSTCEKSCENNIWKKTIDEASTFKMNLISDFGISDLELLQTYINWIKSGSAADFYMATIEGTTYSEIDDSCIKANYKITRC